MSDRILVTGAAGYVGSIVVAELLARGASVRAFDSLAHGGVPSLLLAYGDPRFEFVRADVRDRSACRAAVAEVHAIVHLAAIVGDPACARQPELARQVNLDATKVLLEEAKAASVERFLFASTCSNYGRIDSDALATEELELSPISLYAETKVAAEREVLAQSDSDISASCLRFATVFGTSPRMRFDLTVNEFTRDVALTRALTVYGEQFWRPYIHVRDAARAVALALEAPRDLVAAEVFNVGDTDENYRKLDIVALLEERFDDARVEYVHKEEDPRDYRVSFEKVRETLGFRVERSVADGIDEVAALLESGMLADPFAPIYRN